MVLTYSLFGDNSQSSLVDETLGGWWGGIYEKLSYL